VTALQLEVLPDADAVASGRQRSSPNGRGRRPPTMVGSRSRVSGGHTPWAMFTHLAGRMPCEKVTIYQVDERVAPEGDLPS
jgi:hypothetical protein